VAVVGWFTELMMGRRGLGGFEQEAAEAAVRGSILANGERDRLRAQELADLDEVRVRWRWCSGRWQRWSQLEAGFVEAPPPDSLLALVDRAEGAEVVLVDGEWVPAEDAPAGPAPVTEAVPDQVVEEPPEPDAPAAFAAQLDAWRRRR
jgi:hypothetical protein